MKRLMLLTALLILMAVGIAYAAAPVGGGHAQAISDVTVTRALANSASTMQVIGGGYQYGITDTGYVVATLTGTALLGQFDKLYIGFREIRVNDSVVVDTFQITNNYGTGGNSRVPFSIIFVDSLISQTQIVDTLYINAAVGGTSHSERVQLEDLFLTIQILDGNETAE